MVIKNLDQLDLDLLLRELKLDKSPFRAATATANLPNVLSSNQDHIFIYVEQIGAFVAIHVTSSKQMPHGIADTTTVQYLNINSPPIGRLKKCLVSPDGNYILVVCDKSATVVDLPSKWGKSDRYEGGKTSIICKSTKLNVSKNLDIVDAVWHSSSQFDSNMVVCLTSDNYLRFFKTTGFSGSIATVGQFKEFHLEKTYSHIGLSKDHLSSKVFRLLSIDIGSRMRYCDKFAYPIFALKSNGQVECLIEYEQSHKFDYLGPLDLAPYCMDVEEENQVRSFLCLRGAPNCLAILLSNGLVYHCLLMTNLKDTTRSYESENNFKEYYSQETADMNLNSGETILYAYESIKLEENNSSVASFEFLRDPINNWRYFIYHSSGAHSISLPWFESLQEIYEKEQSLHEFDESKLCEINQIISTRPFPEKQPNLFILGSTLFYNYSKGEQSLICLSNQAKLIDINITTRNLKDIEGANDEFVNYIASFIKRDASMPYLKASDKDSIDEAELKHLMNNAMNLIKTEYIEKHRQVIAEFKKKSQQLKQQETVQFNIIREMDARLDEFKSKRIHLLARFEHLLEMQQKIKKRMEDALNQLFLRCSIPKSEIENEMHYDLKAINQNLKESINKIQESKRVLDEDQNLLQSSGETIKSDVEESDIKLIKSLLKNQSDKIKALIQKVEIITQAVKSAAV